MAYDQNTPAYDDALDHAEDHETVPLELAATLTERAGG